MCSSDLQVREATGLIAEAEGRAVLALLPRPRVKISNVRIRDRDGRLTIEAEQLRGELRVLPMFAGRLELVSASLLSPKIAVDLDANPFADQGAIARIMERAAGPAGGDATDRLGKLTFTEGTAHVHSATRAIDARIGITNLEIDWPRADAAAGVKGAVRLGEHLADIAAWIGRPADLLRGRKSDLSLRLASPRFAVSFNGAVTPGPALMAEGSLSASTPDLRTLAAGVDRTVPLPGPLENVTLAGALRLTPASIAVSDLRLAADGNAYEGALAFVLDRARPTLSGTLATDNLDTAPFAALAPPLVETDGEWSRVRLPVSDPARIDVDLRLSASRARIGRAQLREAAFSLLAEPERLSLTLEEAKAWNGVIKAQLAMGRGEAGAALRASANLARVDAAAMMGELFRTPRLSGELNGDVALTSNGETLARALRNLNGTARLSVRNGDVSGLDLEQALRRLEKRPLTVASEVRTGRTGFNAAELDLGVENGRATIRTLRARGAGVEFTVKGAIGVPERALELTLDRKSTRLNSSPIPLSRIPSSA